MDGVTFRRTRLKDQLFTGGEHTMHTNARRAPTEAHAVCVEPCTESLGNAA